MTAPDADFENFNKRQDELERQEREEQERLVQDEKRKRREEQFRQAKQDFQTSTTARRQAAHQQLEQESVELAQALPDLQRSKRKADAALNKALAKQAALPQRLNELLQEADLASETRYRELFGPVVPRLEAPPGMRGLD